MPCGWEGNSRSGVALAMRHRHSGSPCTGSRPRRGRWSPACALVVVYGKLYRTFTCRANKMPWQLLYEYVHVGWPSANTSLLTYRKFSPEKLVSANSAVCVRVLSYVPNGSFIRQCTVLTISIIGRLYVTSVYSQSRLGLHKLILIISFWSLTVLTIKFISNDYGMQKYCCTWTKHCPTAR